MELLFFLQEPSSMDNHRCTSVQGTRDDDNNPNDNSETNQQELTEEDINIFVENEQEEATKGNNAAIDSRYIPRVGTQFKTITEAHEFFNFYALLAGFSIVRAHNYHTTSKKRNGEVTRVTFRCNRQGKPTSQSKSVSAEETVVSERNTNENDATDCKCALVISERNEIWNISRVQLDHNHQLSPRDEVRFLKSHKHMTTEEKMLIRTLKECNIPTRHMIVILSVLRGGLTSLPYTKKDISNVRTTINKETSSNDMMKTLEFFRRKKEKDPHFFYEFDLDESKKVKNLFWTDGRSREWYEKYGDVVSFDTTYFTNRYNLPFAPFVGISGHGNTIVFGCAFLHDETSETFKWLFRTFLKAMSQKEPKTIITDQDGAMRSAIAQVFQNAKHRNCFFHIVKKAFNLSGNLFKAKEGLYDEYEDIINNSVTEEEFEYLWQEMIDSFEVQHINFLKHMWSIRKRFIPVYFKGDFCPFIKSTALSEGTNSRFKNNVGPQYSITNFMIEYERVMDTIQNLEQFDDHISRTKKPSKLWSHYYIEYQAMRMYNRKIFIKFQVELKRTTRFQINEVEKFKTYEVFLALNQNIQVIRRRKYLVIVDLEKEDFNCICSKFEKDGLLCCHVLKVMLHLNAMKIPEKYIIERWTKKEYKGLGGKGNGNIPLAQSSILRFNILSRKSAEIASNGSKSNETFQFAVEEMDKIAKQLELMCSNKDAEQEINDSDPNAEDNLNSHEKGNQQSEENTEEILLDPDIAKSKGRPAQRYKTIREEIQQKELYHCSHCQRTDHTFPTCPLKHVEFDLPRKKRRKVKNTREQVTKITNPYELIFLKKVIKKDIICCRMV